MASEKRTGQKQCDVCKRWFAAELCVTSTATGMTYCPFPEWHQCVKPEDREEAA